MSFNTNLEIDFYQQEELSVFMETSVIEPLTLLSDIMTFNHYTMRQISNLGNNIVSTSIIEILSKIDPAGLLVFSERQTGFKLVQYHHGGGRKRFTATVSFNDYTSKFILNAKGFGILGRGIGYYVPTSIMGFLKYLVDKYADNDSSIRIIAESCRTLSELVTTEDIKPTNVDKIALHITELAMLS